MNLKDLNNLRADTEGRIKAVFLICMFVQVDLLKTQRAFRVR